MGRWRVVLGLACAHLAALGAHGAASATPYNVLWLTGESLRPDHLGCYGYDKPTSPRIDALAARGVLWRRAFSASSWTTESMISNFLSLYSPAHGVITRDRAVPAAWKTPFKILAERGYLIPRMTDYQQPEQIAHRDLGYTESTVNNAPPWDWIAAHKDRPFFMWYHLYESHLPYDPPQPHRSLFWDDSLITGPDSKWRIDLVMRRNLLPRNSINFFPERDGPPIRALYDGEVRTIDEKLGRILDALEAAALSERTLVVFSADHGEGLLDHDYVGHTTTLLAGTLYNAVLHVPLILSLPGVLPEGVTVETQVRAIDVMPTVFELLGIAPPEYFQGESLSSTWQDPAGGPDRVAFAATSNYGYLEPDPENVTHVFYSVQAEGWKLILEREDDRESARLFNLAIDPGETRNLSAQEPAKARSLRDKITTWLNDCQAMREKAGDTHPFPPPSHQ
ncbi:sulfatase-like hydrolase/transferase [bacterium]|nr:sulfatase-like hydrolase/transferase [bacterium]